MGFAIYTRYAIEPSTAPSISYIAHLTGALAGLTIGLLVLKSFEQKLHEQLIWWIALGVYSACTIFAIAYNLLNTIAAQKLEENGVLKEQLMPGFGIWKWKQWSELWMKCKLCVFVHKIKQQQQRIRHETISFIVMLSECMKNWDYLRRHFAQHHLVTNIKLFRGYSGQQLTNNSSPPAAVLVGRCAKSGRNKKKRHKNERKILFVLNVCVSFFISSPWIVILDYSTWWRAQ